MEVRHLTCNAFSCIFAEQTNTWARDDPAFIVLQLGMLAVRLCCRIPLADSGVHSRLCAGRYNCIWVDNGYPKRGGSGRV